MSNPNFTEIIATTLRNRSTEFADNISRTNALLRELNTRDRKVSLDGGRTICEGLDYQENSTFTWYSGYETLPVTPSDVLTDAEFPWKQAYVGITMSGLERRQNMGSSQVADLLIKRVENGIRTLGNNISLGVYSDGTGSGGKIINGLQLLVADTPTTGTVGGIDRATYTYWRNQRYRATTDGGAAVSAANVQLYFTRAFNLSQRGPDKCNLIVAESTFFDFYVNSLQQFARFSRGDKMGLGSLEVDFNGVPVLREVTGSGIGTRAYFLNTDYLHYNVHEDADVAPLDPKSSVNQDAMVQPVIWMGNLTISNCFLQVVLTNT